MTSKFPFAWNYRPMTAACLEPSSMAMKESDRLTDGLTEEPRRCTSITTLRSSRPDGKTEQSKGTYGRPSRGSYPFHAKPFEPQPVAAKGVPSIAGLWDLAVKSPKGESAWRFIVRQSGPEVSAAILRVDGDTETPWLYRDGRFVLSHFSGARPLLLEITPVPDGTLEILQNKKNRLTAVRSAEARAQGRPGNRPTPHAGPV